MFGKPLERYWNDVGKSRKNAGMTNSSLFDRLY
jgi:hypothetical protein